MLIYSYVITSLPKKVQVYNNTTTSSSTAIAYTIGWSGARGTCCSLGLTSCKGLEDSGTDRAKEDGPADAWLVETVGFTGWLKNDGAPS